MEEKVIEYFKSIGFKFLNNRGFIPYIDDDFICVSVSTSTYSDIYISINGITKSDVYGYTTDDLLFKFVMDKTSFLKKVAEQTKYKFLSEYITKQLRIQKIESI